MDEVARRLLTPSSLLRNSATVPFSHHPQADQDLLGRIRALLVSRNEHHPPKTPLPTPEIVLLSPRATADSPEYFEVAGALERILTKKLIDLVPPTTDRSREFSAGHRQPYSQRELSC